MPILPKIIRFYANVHDRVYWGIALGISLLITSVPIVFQLKKPFAAPLFFAAFFLLFICYFLLFHFLRTLFAPVLQASKDTVVVTRFKRKDLLMTQIRKLKIHGDLVELEYIDKGAFNKEQFLIRNKKEPVELLIIDGDVKNFVVHSNPHYSYY